MKLKYKVLSLVMFVMLICCVSAASAADVDNITVPDDTSVIEIDDAVDSVDEVESEGIDDTADNDDSASQTRGMVTPTTYQSFFDPTTGYITTSDSNLIFSGNFDNITFDTFRINKNVVMDASAATFINKAFDLQTSDIVLNGGTFKWNSTTTFNSVITIKGSNTTVNGTTINVTALNGTDCYAIDLQNANQATLSNNVIDYTDTYANTANYNYAVKVKGGSKNTMIGNTIIVSVPLKDVDYTNYTTRFPTIDLDLVAGVAVESCDSFKFENNTLNVTANARTGGFPTLDALLIVKSDNVNVTGNKIYEGDLVTGAEQANFLYAIDIYRCNNILIDNNKIDLNSQSGNLTVNGTGAAYGIQLTGPHTGVMISNNNITTANNGPNLGIYSQNTQGATNITVKGNNIKVTGRAGTNPWALVSGMELQDTYATVCGNTIEVTNLGGYHASYCVYGISYSQATSGTHTYIIYNNTVKVPDGDYAVYLDGVVNSNVSYNHLRAHGSHVGNNAVYMTGTSNTKSNNTA